jgi:hypothetical protein
MFASLVRRSDAQAKSVLVMLALVRLFQNCVQVLPAGFDRLTIGSGRGHSPR